MASANTSRQVGFSMFELFLWAAVIVGIVLLIRHLAKSGATVGAAAIAKTAAVPFSPWFPLR